MSDESSTRKIDFSLSKSFCMKSSISHVGMLAHTCVSHISTLRMVHKHLSIFQPYNPFTNEINLSNDWHIQRRCMEHRWNGTFIKFRDVLQKFVDKFSRNFTSKTFPCFQLRYSRKKISCRHIFHIMLILCEKFDSLCAASASITRLVIILSNRLYILLYNQSSIICGLKEREAATKASKSIQLNARLLLLCSLPLM